MATQSLTPQTITAMRKGFQLLEDHFDATNGVYTDDYSDDRIAKETKISLDAVKNYRTSAFGKLKPPSELYKCNMELRDLETLFLKFESEMTAKIKDLRARVQLLQRKFD